ncbi:sodium channel subunit beta-1 isoform X2 [Trichomycterus rosablanca]|uniref:sodium channel subunit beta-1 isoform X2 n=1 Tax=Trichomycterus rosablanca TaxID=2290929 RepID=UPI002F34F019
MTLPVRALLTVWIIVMVAWQCQAGCADVDSMTEAVAGNDFMLGCISCKRRAEVNAAATVDWHFKPSGENDSYHIFRYDYPDANPLHEDFKSRLDWAGTEGTADIQIGAIYIRNVTFNDSGTYTCTFHRTLYISFGEQQVTIQKTVELTVLAIANRELTAVISEIMMYVLIVGLQLWMIGVLVYCYKKIYAENEAREARKALRDKKKLIDPMDSCDGVHME